MKTKNSQFRIGLSLSAMFLALASPLAHAQGDKTGGGGDILTCQEDGKTNYYLLDVYEAKVKGQVVDFGSAQLSIRQKILLAKERYSQMDPNRAERYANEALQMIDDIEAKENHQQSVHSLVALYPATLIDIDDAGEIFTFKDNCKKAQLVRQEKPISPRDPFYTIDQTYWKHLDVDQKVATLYHEVIYREMREDGAKLSKSARVLNALIFSGLISTLTDQEYYTILNLTHLKGMTIAAQFNFLDSPQFDHQGRLIAFDQSYNYGFAGTILVIRSPRFNTNRKLISAELLNPIYLNDSKTAIQKDVSSVGLVGSEVSFDTAGNLIMSNFKKNKDGGVISLTIDPSGKVGAKTETGFYRGRLTRQAEFDLAELLSCARKRIQKNDLFDSKIASLLEEARILVGNEKFSEIPALVQTCNHSLSDYYQSSSPVSDEVKTILLGMHDVKSLYCSSSSFSVRGGVLFVVGAGVQMVTCHMTDGSTRVYGGVGGVIGGGLGGAIGFSRNTSGADGFYAYNEQGGGPELDVIARSVGAITTDRWTNVKSQGDMYAVPLFHHMEKDETSLTEVGLVLNTFYGQGSALIHLFNKKNDFTPQVKLLTKNILTQE